MSSDSGPRPDPDRGRSGRAAAGRAASGVTPVGPLGSPEAPAGAPIVPVVPAGGVPAPVAPAPPTNAPGPVGCPGVTVAVVAPDGTVVVVDATVGGGATPRIVSMDAYVGAAPVPYRQPSTSPSRTVDAPPPTAAYRNAVVPAGARKYAQ